jgi:hypothetical protein
MIDRKFRVMLINGTVTDTLYDSQMDALRAHRGNIQKIIEVATKKKSTAQGSTSNEALFISQRSIEDLEISKHCGYSVMYNCPSRQRIFQGMKYFEVSDDFVLEGEILKLERYNKLIHTGWSHVIPAKENKIWKWVIFHKNVNLLSRLDVEKKYNTTFKGTQGGISYMKIA